MLESGAIGSLQPDPVVEQPLLIGFEGVGCAVVLDLDVHFPDESIDINITDLHRNRALLLLGLRFGEIEPEDLAGRRNGNGGAP